jgi:hypothetical protein
MLLSIEFIQQADFFLSNFSVHEREKLLYYKQLELIKYYRRKYEKSPSKLQR